MSKKRLKIENQLEKRVIFKDLSKKRLVVQIVLKKWLTFQITIALPSRTMAILLSGDIVIFVTWC